MFLEEHCLFASYPSVHTSNVIIPMSINFITRQSNEQGFQSLIGFLDIRLVLLDTKFLAPGNKEEVKHHIIIITVWLIIKSISKIWRKDTTEISSHKNMNDN